MIKDHQLQLQLPVQGTFFKECDLISAQGNNNPCQNFGY